MKPIIFSTPMVRAILDGHKTQTRRVVKPQPSQDWQPHHFGDVHKMEDGEFVMRTDTPIIIGWGASNEEGDEAHISPCMSGGFLWVREIWAQFEGAMGTGFIYKADESHSVPLRLCIPDRWKPSIHMPKAAARLFLRVMDVRVERLQEISFEDCIAEGVINNTCIKCLSVYGTCCPQRDIDVFCDNSEMLVDQFAQLWDSQNAKCGYSCGYSWESNPWVWVYKFKRVETEL